MSADIDPESSTLAAGMPTADAERVAYDETEDACAGQQGRAVGVRRQATSDLDGLHIGRYRIDTQLGAGGMGEVYLAYDQELDRKVALKRVLPSIADGRAQLRLRREARALAKLSHANVVQIYEVGEHGGRTFLAMEYVEGETLGEWLRAEPRAWDDVIGRFAAAGRGLAAAHQAGIVHRDFKADNVLLGRDGNVRVADFGLALADDGPRCEIAGSPVGEERLSTAGAIVGTFRYMPLEQLCGEEVDARSDQFSFCVALYEALWRCQPFESRGLYERITELESSRAKRPAGARVPRKVWRAIRRGLLRAPEARWTSMDMLVDALEAAKRAALRRRFGFLAVAIVLGLNPLVRSCDLPDDEEPDACAGVAAEIDDVWNEARRAELESAFAGTSELSGDGPVRIARELDAWASAWGAERERNCRVQPAGIDEAVRQHHTKLCLARQLHAVDVLVDQLLAHPDARTLARAVASSVDLADPSLCDDVHALHGLVPPSPTSSDMVEGRRKQIQRARTLRLLGHTELALREIAAHDAATIASGPLIAETRAEHAFAELDAGATERGEARLREALDLAEIHHHDRLAAELWTTLADRALTDARVEEATWLLQRANVAWRRVPMGPRDRARLSIVSARWTAVEGGDTSKAEAALCEAIEPLDERDPERTEIHATLAELVAKTQPSEALEHREDAIASATEIWGPDHPETGMYRLDLGLALRDAGQHEKAREQLTRAVAIWTQLREHPRSLTIARAALAELE